MNSLAQALLRGCYRRMHVMRRNVHCPVRLGTRAKIQGVASRFVASQPALKLPTKHTGVSAFFKPAGGIVVAGVIASQVNNWQIDHELQEIKTLSLMQRCERFKLVAKRLRTSHHIDMALEILESIAYDYYHPYFFNDAFEALVPHFYYYTDREKDKILEWVEQFRGVEGDNMWRLVLIKFVPFVRSKKQILKVFQIMGTMNTCKFGEKGVCVDFILVLRELGEEAIEIAIKKGITYFLDDEEKCIILYLLKPDMNREQKEYVRSIVEYFDPGKERSYLLSVLDR